LTVFRQLYDGLTEGQQQFIKFSVVGGVGFLVDAGTFHLLIHFTPLGLVTARIFSSLVFGMSATYMLNRYLTFRNQRSGNIVAEYLRFAGANIVGNLLNIGTHSVLVETLPLFHRLPILGIIAGTAVGLVFNFTGSKYFVFRAAKEPTAARE
jgi:putative flippase GtrA